MRRADAGRSRPRRCSRAARRGAVAAGIACTVLAAGGAGAAWGYLSHEGSAVGSLTVKDVTLTLSAPGTGTKGTAIAKANVKAKLAGGAEPSGHIAFFYKRTTPVAVPTTCSGFTTLGTTVTVTGNATYHPSAALTPATAGTYWWYATYSGSALDPAVHSTCGTGMAKTVVKT